MKTLPTIFLAALIATGSISAQQPVIITKQPISNAPVIKNNNTVLDLNNGMAKYDPNSSVKYIFYDKAVFTQVTGRLLPQDRKSVV